VTAEPVGGAWDWHTMTWQRRKIKGVEPFSREIKRLREIECLTQQEVADKIGIAKTYVCALEYARSLPSWLVIRRLADALHADADELAALAGVVPDDVRRLICERPELAKMVRQAALKFAGVQ